MSLCLSLPLSVSLPLFAYLSSHHHAHLQAAASRRIWFDRRRVRHNKFAEQHNKDPAFFRHEKHVFILSFAGRPIFSRYGDETLLAAYMGVISAIIRCAREKENGIRVCLFRSHF